MKLGSPDVAQILICRIADFQSAAVRPGIISEHARERSLQAAGMSPLRRSIQNGTITICVCSSSLTATLRSA
jgi:hypothetical protein